MSESKENKQEALQKENEYKVTWKGWVSLAFLTISFSGLVAHQDNFLKAFDLMNLMGQFGHADGAKIAMQGTGGFGAREGFAFALTMVPVTMLAQGLIETCEYLGALKAAGKLFQPFLRFLLGIPGVAGLAFISSFTSSDIGAFMTKNLFEEGMMNDDERTIFAAYQYAGSAVINNTIASGAALLPISILPVGVVIVLIIIVKFIGANFVRFYLKYYHRRHPESVLPSEEV